jgi:catechol 2,3-dioxygenase-like lactoylglutathione lyase family enzyme
MPTLPPHYHVGIVVPDVAAARARLTAQLGLRWGPVFRMDDVPYRDGSGAALSLPSTLCYSVDQPCLELIEAVPGTVWELNGHSNLHHVGIWSDDLLGDSTGLAGAGCPLQLCGRDGDDDDPPAAFAYHRDDELGVRFELVDATMRDAMSFLFEPDPEPA